MITLHVARERDRVGEPPAVFAQQRLGRRVGAHGQFERFASHARQVEHFQKLAVLRPVVALAVVDDVAALVLPRRDRVVGAGAGGRNRVGPEIEHDGRAGGTPVEAPERHAAVGRAEVAAVAEMRVVRRERGDGARVALGHLDLRDDGIGLDVEAARAREVFVAEFLRAGDVEECVGLAVERENLGLTQAVTATAGIISAERPAAGEAVGLEHRHDGREVRRRVGREVVEFHVVDPAARVLDVIRVVAEPAQPDQVIQELVGDARERIPKHDPEDDDLALRLHVSPRRLRACGSELACDGRA